MINPEEASKILQDHFHEVTTEQFVENVRSYSPELMGSNSLKSSENEPESDNGQLILLHPESYPLPLRAYFASALTTLDKEQRDHLDMLADAVRTVASWHSIELYEPAKKTDPVKHANIPASEVHELDKEQVLSSDLVIHPCHFASTGAGIELETASSALIPIILISPSNVRVSRMITGIPAFKVEIEYKNPQQLKDQLYQCLTKIRPILEQRKMTLPRYEVNIVGDRIRIFRENLGLTREEVASSSNNILTVERLRGVENSTDRVSNVSLTELREIAYILKTTVADLVEPNLEGRIMDNLQDWLFSDKAAARNGFTSKDQKKVMRRMLLRMIDTLEEE